MTTQLDAVIEKHAASKTPAVLLVDVRHYDDSPAGASFSVDILEYEALGLYDTHALFFRTGDEAQVFANGLAYLLGISVEIIL